jgi:hypothetical protein
MTNPFMSLWLSAFNTAAGTARGYATAELHRQQAAFWREMTRQTTDFWTGAWLAGPARSMVPQGKAGKPRR